MTRERETAVVEMAADLAGRLCAIIDDRAEIEADGSRACRETLEEWVEEVATVVGCWRLDRMGGTAWQSPALWHEVADSLELRARRARAMAVRASGPSRRRDHGDPDAD